MPSPRPPHDGRRRDAGAAPYVARSGHRAHRAAHAARGQRVPQELLRLAHRHARIGPDRQEAFTRLPECFLARDAQKMPRVVFDVVGVDEAMRFELLAAVPVAACVIESDPPLPQLRSRARRKPRHLIEPAHRLGDPAVDEVVHRPVEHRLHRRGVLRGGNRPHLRPGLRPAGGLRKSA